MCYYELLQAYREGQRLTLLAQQFGGEHTDEKLKILRLYLDFFTQVLKASPSASNPFKLAYVDPFCGNGHWQSAGDPRIRDGSPLIALNIDNRPFDEFYFNDITEENVTTLREIISTLHPDRSVNYDSESSDAFLSKLCPMLRKSDNPDVRGVVFLDPFATQVSWVSIEAIARTQTLDLILLFPLSALTRSTPLRHERKQKHQFESTLGRVFGDRSWERLYDVDFNEWYEANRSTEAPKNPRLFDMDEIEPNPTYEFRAHASAISYLYRERLKTVFSEVSNTFAVLGSQGSPLFEVHFAVSNPSKPARSLAKRGAEHILRNYKDVQIKD